MSPNNYQCKSFYEQHAPATSPIDNSVISRQIADGSKVDSLLENSTPTSSKATIVNKKKPWLLWILVAAVIYGTAEDAPI